MRFYCLLVVAGLATVGAGLAMGGQPAPGVSEALLPVGRPSVKDPHPAHAELEMSCSACHPRAVSSGWASERLTPRMEVCAECHPAAEGVTLATPVTDECRACHGALGPGERPLPGYYPRPNIRFSHKAHREKMPCGMCHPRTGSYEPRGPGRDVVSMRECYQCHSRSACRTCHLVQADGRMVTDFGEEKLVPPDWLKGPSHKIGWAGTHAATAGGDSSYCGACHRESFCRDCHTGKLRPRNIHPGDWLTSHGLNTRLDSPRCKGCHRKQSFCLTCHRRMGVAPDSPEKARPQGGMGRYHKGLDTRYLMRRARHDITSCVSCHSESSCLGCHIGPKGFNPHPPGFASKCKPLVTRNPRSCDKCHGYDAKKRCK